MTLPDDIMLAQRRIGRISEKMVEAMRQLPGHPEVTFASVHLVEHQAGRVYEIQVRIGFDEEQPGDKNWPWGRVLPERPRASALLVPRVAEPIVKPPRRIRRAGR